MIIDKYKLRILGDLNHISIDTSYKIKDNIKYITLNFATLDKIIFPEITLNLLVPAIDIHYKWNSKIHLLKALNLDWFNNLNTCNGFTGAPVESLMTYNNENRFTLALSDTLSTIKFNSTVSEETANYEYNLTLFENCNIKQNSYSITLRIDDRPVPYYTSLDHVARWWETLENNKPAFVPDIARKAMYSSWYSFHQLLDEKEILNQCKLSKALGCESIIIDDGWQTDDNNRGYAYCGDWDVSNSKIKDMKRFVKNIHNEGMKILFWYTVPFIGNKSKIFNTFKDMIIDPINNRDWHVFDPRFPEVRDYIIGVYEKALIDWDLDGFKLDFVDEFVVTPFSGNINDERRDYESISEAADKLLKDCISRLKSIKPDIMLEFRQTYNGPIMRTYGNIFRAVDCPLDDLENRIRICDIRLIAGNSAVHSDMIMWNVNDTVESAALQFINILFSVPQISMLIDKLPKNHYNMLKFYCNLWNKYRNSFINGSFMPLNPHCRYNVLTGYKDNTFVCTYHSNEILSIDKTYNTMVFVNGTYGSNLNLNFHCNSVRKHLTISDCTGKVILDKNILLSQGYNKFNIPPCGVAEFK
ncbi:glycoside hydrolase family 36 protein [Clostridium butyricum]|uniref:glycoside hydrolase family 36 protein n=1 Tax=Clostridium butyricum TaxID=1492 RepID=UPI00040E723B|nr:glycoside hydrolase family 36 protein [Clostridium butyricum]